jgi:hypothetical protein
VAVACGQALFVFSVAVTLDCGMVRTFTEETRGVAARSGRVVAIAAEPRWQRPPPVWQRACFGSL